MPLVEALKKQTKSSEDIHFLYEEIRKFSFFKEFQERFLKAWELEDVLSMCKSFTYEECQSGEFLFKVGDGANDKIYVLLSGQVEVTNFIKPPPLANSSFRKGKRRGVKNNRNQSLEISDFHLPPNHIVPTPKRASMDLRDLSQFKDLKTEITLQGGTSQILPNASNMQHRSSLFMLESVYISEITSLQINDESQFKSKEEVTKQEENFDSYKKFLQFVKEQEIFGEACLQGESSVRLSTAFCKTHCQFLVMNKEFFDVMAENKKEDKEEFLKQIFPCFKNIISFADLRYLLRSFTTEVFNKGSLVTSEKTEVQPEEAKLYLIFKGECRIEKNLELEKNIPFDKSRPVVGNQQPIQISFLGKGMIFGEEILTNDKNEYCYNIKVSSDVLFVYSITKREFRSSFFEKVCQQVLSTFEKKKTQREGIFENAKKDYEARLLQLLPETVSYAKNVPIGHLITRSASMSLNRYVHREQKLNEQKEAKTPQVQTPVMSPKSPVPVFQSQQGGRKSSSPRKHPLDFSEALQVQDDVVVPVVKAEEKRMIKLIETENPKRMKMETKMQFMAKIPFDKKDVEVPNPRNLENFKLFPETDPQKLKYLRVLKVKSSGSFRMQPKAATPTTTNSPQHRFGSILKEQLKDTSNYHELSQNLVDAIRPQTQNGTARERPTSAFSFSMPSSPKSPARHFAIERLLGTPQHKNRELRPQRNISTAASNNGSPTHQNNLGDFSRKVISVNQSFDKTDGILTPDLKNSNWLESRIQESPSRWRQLRSPGRSSFMNLEDVDSHGKISSPRTSTKAVQPSLHVMNLQLIKPRTAHNKRLAEAKARNQRVFQKTTIPRPQSAVKLTSETLSLTGIKK